MINCPYYKTNVNWSLHRCENAQNEKFFLYEWTNIYFGFPKKDEVAGSRKILLPGSVLWQQCRADDGVHKLSELGQMSGKKWNF